EPPLPRAPEDAEQAARVSGRGRAVEGRRDGGGGMKRCEEVVPLLGPLYDGALADDDRAWVEDHVRGCRSCQDRLALIGAQARALRGVVEARAGELDLSGLADRVMARIGQERPGFSQRAPVWGREMWWARRGAFVAGGGLA